jgi:hypothetical protein
MDDHPNCRCVHLDVIRLQCRNISHADHLLELFNIDITGYRVVSDQGSPLPTVCGLHEKPQFLCLRHFLVSLKRKMSSQKAGTFSESA